MLTTHRMIKNKYEIRWLNNFELLKEFKNEFGRFPKSNEKYKSINLGKWCASQRQAYKGNVTTTINLQRIDLLESIGFFWDVHEEQWYDTFYLLMDFIDEFNRFPHQEESYKNINIGRWCTTQRQAYKGNVYSNLNKQRIEMLNSINFQWDIEDVWYKKFIVLKEFVEKYKRFPKRREIYKNIHLGNWCVIQCRSYKNNNMNEERIKLLKSINFRF